MNWKAVWRSLFWINWLVILAFWWRGAAGIIFQDLAWALIALGRLAGLAAAYTVLLQFFFMGRTPWLERIFGLDVLSRIHHANGRRSLVFLLLHPALLLVGNSMLGGMGFIEQLKSFLFDYPYVGWAAIGLGLFVVVVITSLNIVRLKLRYEYWYFVHLCVYLAVFLALFHQFKVGTDLLGSRIFYWYWISLYGIVFGSHALFRFGRPLFNFWRHRFYVERLVAENNNVTSVYITGRHMDKFRAHSGQFMILRFLDKKRWWQPHPFSLSMVPDGKNVRVSIKNSGDFTKDVPNIKPGTKLIIDGPYGIFTEKSSRLPKVLFIAGGIGITPIRSLMEQMARHGKNVILLFSNKTTQDIVFKEEFEKVTAANPNARVVHVITNDPAYPGEKGYLDKEKIFRLVPDVAEREVFLCGPVPMMDALLPQLKELGIKRENIHFEKFSLG